MKNKLKFIPFLLAVPLLFMANSPYPYDRPILYEDFSAEVISYNYEKNESVYINELKLSVNNTGDGYMNLDYFAAKKGDEKVEGYSPVINGLQTPYNHSLLLPPDETNTVEYDLTTTSRNEFDFNGATITYKAFITYEKVEGVDYKIELTNKQVTSYDLHIYTFEVSGLKGFESNYYYSGIVDFTVNGTHLGIYSADWDSGETRFDIYAYEDLNESDFVFNALYKLKGREIWRGYSPNITSLIIAVSIVAATFVAGGAVGLFFAIEGSERRKKRLNQKS